MYRSKSYLLQQACTDVIWGKLYFYKLGYFAAISCYLIDSSRSMSHEHEPWNQNVAHKFVIDGTPGVILIMIYVNNEKILHIYWYQIMFLPLACWNTTGNGVNIRGDVNFYWLRLLYSAARYSQLQLILEHLYTAAESCSKLSWILVSSLIRDNYKQE